MDNDGHFPWLAFAIGAAIGGASAGIQSYQDTGKVNFASVAMGAAIGGLSGAALSPATTAASFQITAFPKTSMFLLKSSAALSLGSQITGAAGLGDVSRSMALGAQYLGYAFVGLHVGTGIANWINDPRAGHFDLKGNSTTPNSGESIFTNGVGESLDESLARAAKNGADELFWNPPSSSIADLTEAFLQKITLTSSIDRQLSNSLVGLTGINLTGYSQGALTVANTGLNLGLRGHNTVLANARYLASPITQIRAYLSAGMSGLTAPHVIYSNRTFDIINLAGPNLNPIKLGASALSGSTIYSGVHEHLRY